MTTNSLPPIVPGPGDAESNATKEVDGDEVLDADANDDLIDSADADRLATEPDA
ncbi:hypothetical protein [Microbacterium hatanonis]|jgi:hypothetical protein|uniref:hypothetical protein n=1 Tax=Microbacterium hatanonis TaxID=404366 RepID=UPI00164F85DD|nr:hypothetical protein [Microbacterium hatanonis]